MHITPLLLLAVLGIHFSFLSSLLNVPFDTANNALTIYRCGSATQYVTTYYHTSSKYIYILLYRCSDCLPAGSACGWCIISSICSGLSSDCLAVNNFMQVNWQLKCLDYADMSYSIVHSGQWR